MELLKLEKAFKAPKCDCAPTTELCPQGHSHTILGTSKDRVLPSCPGQPVGLGQPFP